MPPSRQFVSLKRQVGLSEDDWQLQCEAVLEDAAFNSLVQAQETTDVSVRLVASGEGKPGQTFFDSWDQIDSLYTDDLVGRTLAARALASADQEETDELVTDLFNEPLMWFDVSEREFLAAELKQEI